MTTPSSRAAAASSVARLPRLQACGNPVKGSGGSQLFCAEGKSSSAAKASIRWRSAPAHPWGLSLQEDSTPERLFARPWGCGFMHQQSPPSSLYKWIRALCKCQVLET